MVIDDYVEEVYKLIGSGKSEKESGIYRNAIQLGVGDALQAYAMASIMQPWRPMLEDDYTLAITSKLATFGANADILAESILICDHVVHANVTPRFKPVTRLSDLEFAIAISGMPFGFYCPTKFGVYIDHATATLTGNLTVRAVKIPALSAVKAQTEIHLIQAGATLMLKKLIEGEVK